MYSKQHSFLSDYGCFVAFFVVFPSLSNIRSLPVFLFPSFAFRHSLALFICLISEHVLFLVHYEIVVIHESYEQ